MSVFIEIVNLLVFCYKLQTYKWVIVVGTQNNRSRVVIYFNVSFDVNTLFILNNLKLLKR